MAPFFEDSTLWPLLVVLGVVLGTFGASILLRAVRDRSPFAIAALLGLAWMSSDAVRASRRRGRLGRLGWLVLALWALMVLLAGLALSFGML